MKAHSRFLIWVVCVMQAIAVSGQSVRDFERDFASVASVNFDTARVTQLLETYGQLLCSVTPRETLADTVQSKGPSGFPLRDMLEKPLYQSALPKLFASEFPRNRLLGQLLIIATGDVARRAIVEHYLQTEKPSVYDAWIGLGLVYLGYQRTSVLFPWMIRNLDEAGMILFPMYRSMAADSLRNTASRYVSSENWTERVYAIQSLVRTGYDVKTDSMVRTAIRTWPINLKGYAVVVAKATRCPSLLPLLQPFLDSTAVRKVGLEALAASPTERDREFVSNLADGKPADDDIMEALRTSGYVPQLTRWLGLLSAYPATSKYFFSVRQDSLLRSDALLPSVIQTLTLLRNPGLASQLIPLLTGRKDSASQRYLLGSLLKSDDGIRYYATQALMGSCSDTLAKQIARIIREEKMVTTGSFQLATDCRLTRLQRHARNIFHDENQGHTVRMDALTYLSTYPEESDLALFRSVLADSLSDDRIAWRRASLGLAELGDVSSINKIIRTSERERKGSDWNCTKYLEALAKLKGEKAKSYITSFLRTEDKYVAGLVKGLLEHW